MFLLVFNVFEHNKSRAIYSTLLSSECTLYEAAKGVGIKNPLKYSLELQDSLEFSRPAAWFDHTTGKKQAYKLYPLKINQSSERQNSYRPPTVVLRNSNYDTQNKPQYSHPVMNVDQNATVSSMPNTIDQEIQIKPSATEKSWNKFDLDSEFGEAEPAFKKVDFDSEFGEAEPAFKKFLEENPPIEAEPATKEFSEVPTQIEFEVQQTGKLSDEDQFEIATEAAIDELPEIPEVETQIEVQQMDKRSDDDQFEIATNAEIYEPKKLSDDDQLEIATNAAINELTEIQRQLDQLSRISYTAAIYSFICAIFLCFVLLFKMGFLF